VTPSADELPGGTNIIVRLSHNGLVCLALFYALVVGTVLPFDALARTTIDRLTNIPRPSSLASDRGLEQVRDVGTRRDDLGPRRAQLDQESGAIAVDELDSSEVDAAFRAIGVRREERSQLRDPRAHEASLETHESATVGVDTGNPEHEAKSQQALCQTPTRANRS
jgi:hypothetical protein